MDERFKISLVSTSRSALEDVKKFIPVEEGYFVVSLVTSYNSLKRLSVQKPELVVCVIANRGDEILLETAIDMFGSKNLACVDYVKSYNLTVKLLKSGVISYFTMPEESVAFSDFVKGKAEEWKKEIEAEKFLSIRREQFDFGKFIGSSEKVREIIDLVKKAIEHKDLTILITGKRALGKHCLQG
jgi:DNA-binding NtrC family response regulator